MQTFHADFAWALVILNGIAGLWALGAHRFEALRGRPLWVFTAVAQLTFFVQAAAGAWLIAVDEIEADQVHTFYGFLTLVGVGLLYSYRHQLREYRYLLYGGGGLFLMGLAIRAQTLA